MKDNFVAAKSASLQVVEYATKLGCLSFKIELTNLSLSIKVYFVGLQHKIIPFYNNKDKPTEVTIRFNNNYETRLPL